MKLLFFCGFGFAANRLLLAKALHAREHGFEVSFAFSPGADIVAFEKNRIPVYPISISKRIRPIQDVKAVTASVKLFHHVRPDIISIHFSKPGAVGRIAAHLSGRPYVLYSPHGFSFTTEEPWTFRKHLFVQFERFLSSWCDVILTQTVDDALLAQELGFRPRLGELIVVGNGIDLTRFTPRSQPPHHIRRDFGIGERTRILTTFARINDVKGLRELAVALGMIRDLDWVLMHYGPIEDPILYGDLLVMLRHLEIEDRFHFQGLTDATPSVLAETDVFVLPSRIEGMPRSLIEAQVMGIPVVATNIRGSRNIVVDGETGFLVPACDPASLAEGLRRILGLSNGELSSMGERARRRAVELYDEELVKEKLLAVYRQEFSSIKLSTGRVNVV